MSPNGELQASETSIARLRELLLTEDRRVLDELDAQVKGLGSRAGTDEALRSSVARIIDGALKDAEVARHKELSAAIAPVVVSTIKREIVNSRDEMVEALYPITGQLVQTYVAHAMRKAMAGMNDKLESGFSLRRWWLRLKAGMTGRSYEELLLLDLNMPRVDELYLIRRGSGEVIEHWQRTPAKPERWRSRGARDGRRQKLVGSFLSALTEFSQEAFAAERSSMRTLDLSGHRIYFRDSPAHLLAAKCAGNLPTQADDAVDELFLGVLQAIARGAREPEVAGVNGHAAAPASLMPTFAGDLQTRLADLSEPRSKSPTAALALLGLIGLGLVGWLAWWAYGSWTNDRIRTQVEAVISGDAELQSYPLQVVVSQRGAEVRVFGLVPSEAVRDRLSGEIARSLDGSRLSTNLQVVPGGHDANLFIAQLADLRQPVNQLARRMQASEQALADARQKLADTEKLLAAYPPAVDVNQSIARLGDVASVQSGQQAALVEQQSAVAAQQQALAAYPSATAITTTMGQVSELAGGLAELKATLAALKEALDGFPPASEIRTLFVHSEELAAEVARLIEAQGGLRQGTSDVDQRQTAAVAAAAATLADVQAQLVVAKSDAVRGDQSARDLIGGLDRQLEQLRQVIAGLRTPDQELRDFAAANAIFFSEETNFRDEPLVKSKLRRLAALIAGAAPVSVQVIGRASAKGDRELNAQLSRDRAERVISELLALGVERQRLSVETVLAAPEVTVDPARDLFDRRVEFRVGFLDERR